MSVPNEIRNLTEGVVASFESGIGAVELLVEKGLEILDGYHSEQDAIRGNLRQAFASVGSLRRKDFDGMMEWILEFQSQREVELKRLIHDFLGRQKDLIARLRRSLVAGIFTEVERCKGELSGLIEKVRSEIQSFQGEQEKIRETLKMLEGRKDLPAREFKKAIQELETELVGGRSVVERDRQSAVL